MREPLPWGEGELERAKDWLCGQVDKIQAGQGFLGGRHTMGRSELGWRFGDRRALELKAKIRAWVPAEPVLPDHRAEAIRIVYDGMKDAGYVAWRDQRAPRSAFRG